MRYTLIELGWHQPATPISTDYTTATSIVNGTFKMRKSKSIDMRYDWIRERCNDFKDFAVTWAAVKSGPQSIADFLTKPHTAKHTATMRKFFVKDCKSSLHIRAVQKFS